MLTEQLIFPPYPFLFIDPFHLPQTEPCHMGNVSLQVDLSFVCTQKYFCNITNHAYRTVFMMLYKTKFGQCLNKKSIYCKLTCI